MEPRSSRSAVGLRLESGPDAGRTIAIPCGPLVLGRATGPGRIDDPALEVHHLLLRCDGRAVTATQLAGRFPVRVDGEVLDAPARLVTGTVVDLGATCAVVTDTASDGAGRAGPVVLGVGVAEAGGRVAAGGWRSFAEQAEIERSRTASTVTVDLDVVGRLLVTGPTAVGLVRAIVAQAPSHLVSVTDRRSALRARPRPGRVVVMHECAPETGWPGDELPPDAIVVDVGVTWQAVLTRWSPDGGSVVVRFRAAGRPAGAPARGSPPGGHGRTGRSSLNR